MAAARNASLVTSHAWLSYCIPYAMTTNNAGEYAGQYAGEYGGEYGGEYAGCYAGVNM